MSLKDFKVLTFDVVGTLIDFEGGMLAYLRSVAPDARVSDDDFLAAYRRARADGNAGWYPDDLARCWHAVAPALGLPDDDAIAQGLRDSVSQWPAFPDAVEALKRLGKRFKLVTMTNAQAWALAHFDKTLGSPFDMLLSCDDALYRRAVELVPALEGSPVTAAWAGYVDSTPDGVPGIGEMSSLRGLVLAAGFSGHGFGIGPGAGHLIADIVSGAAPLVDPRPYHPDRFLSSAWGKVADF